MTSDPEFISKGDYVYDVLLDMKVHKQSEFYTDGITRHIFILNKTNEGLKIETVYYKGLVDEENEESTLNYIPIEPVPRPIPVNIKLYDTSKSQLKTLTLRTYIKDVMPNEIYVTWPTESLKANILAAKTYAWYNIENPRKPATDYNAHVTDKWANYQHYKEGSNHATTNSLVDQLYTYAMLRSQGPFDAQYRAGSQGSTGTNGGNILSQWGTVQLANQGYTYTQILKYYYTNTFVANYYPVPHLIQ
ncbi:SpoIID/LytB domain-containing protein [Metasolibacillus meyeri]|uniref:SpoIID/LytB domain-containing protein n=1 Tax=Metasolibacillus meyeri TaxID=1071052 RepID=A0AAW9NN78_9BACL|nr:SpoIID/LytB domain-containing protein [Metasolibacillus meyeri]MEC1177163.1 SpoIID/LytB domain-containing protein [Metasolibacillus meyeri]